VNYKSKRGRKREEKKEGRKGRIRKNRKYPKKTNPRNFKKMTMTTTSAERNANWKKGEGDVRKKEMSVQEKEDYQKKG